MAHSVSRVKKLRTSQNYPTSRNFLKSRIYPITDALYVVIRCLRAELRSPLSRYNYYQHFFLFLSDCLFSSQIYVLIYKSCIMTEVSFALARSCCTLCRWVSYFAVTFGPPKTSRGSSTPKCMHKQNSVIILCTAFLSPFFFLSPSSLFSLL